MNLTLGQFINKLKNINPELRITYDFGCLSIAKFDSYRGYYKDLALGYTEELNFLIVKELLIKAEDCIGKAFTGYKGGEFYMNEDTILWAANYGRSSDTAIVDVLDLDYKAIIVTSYYEG